LYRETIINRGMDLFTPITPRDKWHANFASLIARQNQWNDAVLCDWAKGFPDRDGKFVREFQTTFNGCFWELYLHAVLRNRGLSIDFSVQSPDFLVTKPWQFAIEATIASNSIDTLPEESASDVKLPADLNEFNREAIVRVSNSLTSKYRKYKEQYAALAHMAGKPFVLALAPFHTRYFTLTCQRAIEAVLFNYYVDEEAYLGKGQMDSPIPRGILPFVQKDNGTRIELGLFQNGNMPEISAVIFSSCATWGKLRALSKDSNPNIFFTALRSNSKSHEPQMIQSAKANYHETLLDGLRVYHNPAAQYPLDPAIFRSPEVFQAHYCSQAGSWVYEQADGLLLFRRVETQVARPK